MHPTARPADTHGWPGGVALSPSMPIADLNLIRLFSLYLTLMMCISLWRRWRVYADAVRLGWTTFTKRKKLLGRVGQQVRLLFTRSVVVPFAVVVAMTVVQYVCSYLIWPHAVVPLGDVGGTWWKLLPVAATALPMLGVDVYFLVKVGTFDRRSTEEYLDYAERWLGWRGRVVRAATVGVVNPTKIVDAEVRKSLEYIGETARWAMWWTSVQSVLRVAFGLLVWLLWATHSPPAVPPPGPGGGGGFAWGGIQSLADDGESDTQGSLGRVGGRGPGGPFVLTQPYSVRGDELVYAGVLARPDRPPAAAFVAVVRQSFGTPFSVRIDGGSGGADEILHAHNGFDTVSERPYWVNYTLLADAAERFGVDGTDRPLADGAVFLIDLRPTPPKVLQLKVDLSEVLPASSPTRADLRAVREQVEARHPAARDFWGR